EQVLQDGKPVYSEKLGVVKDLGLTAGQLGDLDAALKQVGTSLPSDNHHGTVFNLPNTWDVATKTGTWEWRSGDPSKNGDVWTVGCNNKSATAVWLGTKDGNYLKPNGDFASDVFGNNYAGPIWHQFMTNVTGLLFGNTPADQRKFNAPGNPGNLMPEGAVA